MKFRVLCFTMVCSTVLSSGAFAGFINHPMFGKNTWVDSSGLSWSPPFKDAEGALLFVSLEKAKEICTLHHARLPLPEDEIRIKTADPLIAPVEYHQWMKQNGWDQLSFHPNGTRYSDSSVLPFQCVMNSKHTEEMQIISDGLKAKSVKQELPVVKQQLISSWEPNKRTGLLVNGTTVAATGLASYIGLKACEVAKLLAFNPANVQEQLRLGTKVWIFQYFDLATGREMGQWRGINFSNLYEEILLAPFRDMKAKNFVEYVGPAAGCVAIAGGAYLGYKACKFLLGKDENCSLPAHLQHKPSENKGKLAPPVDEDDADKGDEVLPVPEGDHVDDLPDDPERDPFLDDIVRRLDELAKLRDRDFDDE